MRFRLGLILFVYFSQAFAIPCYMTLVKDSCWGNYEVQGQVIDEASKTPLATVTIPKGQQYAQVKFECEPKQKLSFTAKFQPVFWEGGEDVVYYSTEFIYLPTALLPGEVAWNVPICFGESFSRVPLPPGAKGNCTCDFSSVPAITK